MPSATKTTSTNAELQRRVKDLQRQLRSSEGRLHSFLSLTCQTFCLLEFDPPVPTHLPVKDQAAMMLAASVADCNLEFAQLCGADRPDELFGTRFISLVGTTSETLIQRARRFIRSGYRVDQVHNTETLNDGSERHFLNSSRAEILDGHVVRVWVIGRDVTYQWLIEAAARKGDADLHHTAEQLDSAFWVMDWKRFQILYSGPAIEERWGVSHARLLDDPLCWLEKVHDQDRQHVRDAFLTHAPNGHFDETFRVWLPDGSVGWMRNRCIPLPDLRNDELRIVGVAQDVSESRRARSGLSTLFQVTTEMLFVMNTMGILQEVNSRMARQLGYTKEELRAGALLDLMCEEDRSAGRAILSQLASGQPAVEVQSKFQRRDGTVCDLEWNASPGGEDRLIYAAARDITQELHDQDRRESRNEAMAQLNRLSPRQRQIVDLVVEGKASKVIAHELDISQRTVETHRSNLMKKLRLQSTAELVRLAIQAAD